VRGISPSPPILIPCIYNPDFLRNKINFLSKKSDFPKQEKKIPAQEIQVSQSGKKMVLNFFEFGCGKHSFNAGSESKKHAGILYAAGVYSGFRCHSSGAKAGPQAA
jgi:hypothetical protein